VKLRDILSETKYYHFVIHRWKISHTSNDKIF